MPRSPSASLSISLSPSRQLAVAVSVLHLGGFVCAFANDLPASVQGFVALGVVLSGLRCFALHGSRRAAHAIVLLVWDEWGQWRLLQRDGRVHDARLEHGAYSHPRLVVLPFRSRNAGRLRVLIVPDRVDAECLRRLRVRLRCELPHEP